MTAAEIRQQFLDFFKSKGHLIVPSAPIVVKNDPTLMFTNAGMNQFKDIFLGNGNPKHTRIADTQKCLRVSGKHNDLEEVGIDTYHHTMFEMLGNWSFGDYFKTNAIAWAWELLTKVYKLDKDRLYVTIFEGDAKEQLDRDSEAYTEWKKWIAEDRILLGNKKDNFWEMGDTGPCGPCTEIHCDMRTDAERKETDGKALVNASHPQVIEIWNLVFMQFNRKADGQLEPLPAKHVDTGMGFERLVRVLQGKQSNYDTDVFQPLIQFIEQKTALKYGVNETIDIAMRVMSDHVRAVSFTIADGQLPSNTGAGYVIRRILRRAVRYYYSYLNYDKPLLHELMYVLAVEMQDIFPELINQREFITKVILEEELAFLRTIANGLLTFYLKLAKLIYDQIALYINTNNIQGVQSYWVNAYKHSLKNHEIVINYHNGKPFKLIIAMNETEKNKILLNPNPEFIEKVKTINELSNSNILTIDEDIKLDNFRLFIDGLTAFQLKDTYGFPIDLTELLAHEHGITVDIEGYNREMQKQQERSRADGVIENGDWITVNNNEIRHIDEVKFVGYNSLEKETKVLKYREQKTKNKALIQVVLAETPFYAEMGGQAGDTGTLTFGTETVKVIDTKKENDLFIHYIEKLPKVLQDYKLYAKYILEAEEVPIKVSAKVNAVRRADIKANHSATHLLHAALRHVLGTHVQQKGSFLDNNTLRFDFSHFSKMTNEELQRVEDIVNEKIRANIPVVTKVLAKEEAMKLGAMALFGEKYGDVVRVVIIDPEYSVELCGGTHVGYTGEIGLFKITSESAVAAGVRRLEGVTGEGAMTLVADAFNTIHQLKEKINNPKGIIAGVDKLMDENTTLKKQVEQLTLKQVTAIKNELKPKVEHVNGIAFISAQVELDTADAIKKLCYDLKNELPHLIAAIGAQTGEKVTLSLFIDEALVKEKNLDARNIIKQAAAHIKGSGGGQPFFATAGGSDATGLAQAFAEIRKAVTA